jgi:hypothetical protein
MDYSVTESLRQQLTTKTPEIVPLAKQEWLRTPPANESIPGWQATDVNNALPGGQRQRSPHGMEIYGGGADIWRDRDQFHLVWAKASGDLTLAARIDSLHETDKYAKAGIMLRNTVAPGSAHVFLHVFADGRLLVAWRERDGQLTQEKEIGHVGFPVRVELTSKDGQICGRYSKDGSDWHPVAVPGKIELTNSPLAGLAVLSHDGNSSLTRAVFEDIELRP